MGRFDASLAAYAIMLAVIAAFSSQIFSLDAQLFHILRPYNPYLEVAFTAITYLGSSVFWLLVIALFWLDKRRKLSVHLMYAFVIDTALSFVLKFSYMRPRPSQAIGIDLDNAGPSFPSGHSQRAFSGAFILSKYFRKKSRLFYVLSALTALSRIYVGVHYPLDVLVGSISGILVGRIVYSLPTNWLERKISKLTSILES
jgi:undecaprenyl-diphosphatase